MLTVSCLFLAMGDGATPLHMAATSGNAYATKGLLALGANPAKSSYSGLTPLYLAAQRGHDDVATLLIGSVPKSKQRALLDQRVGDNGQTALHAAALHGHGEFVRTLLDAGASASVTENSQGSTPAQYAAHRYAKIY